MLRSAIAVLWTANVGVPHSVRLDTAEQIIASAGLNSQSTAGKRYGLSEDGDTFWERFTKGARRSRFDRPRVHFVGTNSMQDHTARGPGNSGHDQFAWLEKDLGSRPSSLPIIVFTDTPQTQRSTSLSTTP
jgi:3',5'-cyclic-AMP phosphodiesterase